MKINQAQSERLSSLFAEFAKSTDDTIDNAILVKSLSQYQGKKLFVKYEKDNGIMTIIKAIPANKKPFYYAKCLFSDRIENFGANLNLDKMPLTIRNLTSEETTKAAKVLGQESLNIATLELDE